MNWTPVQTDGSRGGESVLSLALSFLRSATFLPSRRTGKEALNFRGDGKEGRC
ncbi:MAG: hypothetical protein LKKZDAJK_001052 [Candidatus Fervidibacter sp.]